MIPSYTGNSTTPENAFMTVYSIILFYSYINIYFFTFWGYVLYFKILKILFSLNNLYGLLFNKFDPAINRGIDFI